MRALTVGRVSTVLIPLFTVALGGTTYVLPALAASSLPEPLQVALMVIIGAAVILSGIALILLAIVPLTIAFRLLGLWAAFVPRKRARLALTTKRAVVLLVMAFVMTYFLRGIIEMPMNMTAGGVGLLSAISYGVKSVVVVLWFVAARAGFVTLNRYIARAEEETLTERAIADAPTLTA